MRTFEIWIKMQLKIRQSTEVKCYCMTRVRTPKMNYMEERKSVWGETFKRPKNKKTSGIYGMNIEFIIFLTRGYKYDS